MNIYFFKHTENEQLFLPFLSEQRRSKADSVKNAAVRREKICSYVLLRYALIREYGFSEPPMFTYGKRGKPYLESRPEIFFSISHAGGLSACAVSNDEIGLDIQDIRPLKADISEKICTESELEGVKASVNPHREICRLWCMKEARGKLTGMGFAEGFSGIDTCSLTEKGLMWCFEYPKGFFTSACTFSPLLGTETVSVDTEEIFKVLKKAE